MSATANATTAANDLEQTLISLSDSLPVMLVVPAYPISNLPDSHLCVRCGHQAQKSAAEPGASEWHDAANAAMAAPQRRDERTG